MSPLLPFWFKQRQGKAEEAGQDTLRLYGPNMPEAFIATRKVDNGHWQAVLRLNADGPDLVTTTPEFDNTLEAWEAAFELFRGHVLYQSLPEG